MSNGPPGLPGPQPSDLRSAALYLTQHGGELDEALDVQVNPATYSEQRARMSLMPSTEVKTALEWYKKQNPDVPFDVVNCSWDDVFDQMARAKGRYEDKFKGPNNFFRWLWRKAGNASEAVQPWLDLIPDEFGLSVVRGSIAVIFHMAQASVKREEQIFGAFEDITDTIASASSKGQSFYGNNEMRQCSVALYVTLLDGVQDLIWTINPDVDGKGVIDRYRHRREKRKTIDIGAMLKGVKQKAVELDRCAERIVTRATLETRKMAGEVQTELHVVRGTALDTKNAAIETRDQVRGLDAAAERFTRGFNATMSDHSRQLDDLDRDIRVSNMQQKKLIDSLDAQNWTIRMFAEAINDIRNRQDEIIRQQNQRLGREWELSQRPRTPLLGYPGTGAPVVSLPVLMDALGVPLSLATRDLSAVLGREEDFKARAQRQAQSLLETKDFRRWLGSRFSELLLVDASLEEAATDSLSAMSLLCATLVASLGRVPPRAVVLHFFCGLHTAPRGPAPGPAGLVRALLTQLAAALRSSWPRRHVGGVIGVLRTQSDLAALRDRRLDTLCAALHGLLAQVPPGTTVFCVIDGVSAFERNYCGYGTELAYVVRALKRMVADEQLPAPVKVLLTSCSRSIDLVRRNVVERWQHVTLLDSGEAGSHAMITDRAVEAALLTGRGSDSFIRSVGLTDGEFDAELVGDDW